jgi:hypothetical protein
MVSEEVFTVSDQRKPPDPGNSRRKVQVDERGRSVWTDPVETAEFELVSTQTLQTLLQSADADRLGEFERIARDSDKGFLARDCATGHFRVIDESMLQAIFEHRDEKAPSRRGPEPTPEPVAPQADDDQELALVSTQALRKILDESEAPGSKPKKSRPGEKFSRDEAGGFDPYNTG